MLFRRSLRHLPSAASASSSIFRHSHTTAAAATSVPPTQVSLKGISDSFTDWFKHRTTAPPQHPVPLPALKASLLSDVDTIVAALSKSNNSSADASAALSAISGGVRLSEELVLRVLNEQREIVPALQFFEWAGSQRGYSHSPMCYRAIFQMLSRGKMAKLLLEMLEKIGKRRAAGIYTMRFHDALVTGYAIAGQLDTALEILARMRFQGIDLDGSTYDVLLTAIVEEGRFDIFDSIFRQIRIHGKDTTAACCMKIRCLCKQGRFGEACDFLREIADKGGKDHDTMLVQLVDELCRSKKFDEADELMREFVSSRNVVPPRAFTRYIYDLVSREKLNDAFAFYRKTQDWKFVGQSPGLPCYNALISGLLRENKLEDVYDLLLEMQMRKIVPDQHTMNATVGFFCKAGMVDIALELFEKRSETGLCPTDYSYNQLINALCHDERTDDAFRVLEDGLVLDYFPGDFTLTLLGETLCRQQKLEKMRRLAEMALQRKILLNRATCARYITALCKSGRADEAYLIPGKFNMSVSAFGAATYADLIFGFSDTRRADMASSLLHEMIMNGHVPRRVLFRAVIGCLCEVGTHDQVLNLLDSIHSLCRWPEEPQCIYNYFIEGAGYAGESNLSIRIYQKMIQENLAPTIDTKVFMLQSFFKSGALSHAMNFFEGQVNNTNINVKLVNLMIRGLCKLGRMELAMNYYWEAREKLRVPSLVSYEVLVYYLCASQDIETLVRVLKDFEDTHRHPSSFIYNMLLLQIVSSDELIQAWVKMTGDCEYDDIKVFGRFFHALYRDGAGGEPCNLIDNLEELMESLYPANTVTWNIFLKAASKERCVDDPYRWLEKMAKRGCEPNARTYDVLLHSLLVHGRTDEAKKLALEMLEMGIEPHIATINLYRRLISNT